MTGRCAATRYTRVFAQVRDVAGGCSAAATRSGCPATANAPAVAFAIAVYGAIADTGVLQPTLIGVAAFGLAPLTRFPAKLDHYEFAPVAAARRRTTPTTGRRATRTRKATP